MFNFQCFIISLLFCIVLSRRNVKIDDTKRGGINYRLPNNTKPETYNIELVTNIDRNDFSFSGKVIIDIRALEDSSYITLHARQLEIKSVNLANKIGLTTVNIISFEYNKTTEFLTISTQQQLQKDANYILTIEYTGELRADLFGFYKQFYFDSQGNKKWLAATQFEPTDARHAFPCYDEPGLKANFTIQIEHGELYNAISNMRETRNPPVNGRVITTFEQTPPISTYLIAFIVSEFEHRDFNATTEFPTSQRVFASKDKINQTSFALAEGKKLLKAIGDYLKVPYILPKLDHASIPYTIVGAMENFGLITYPSFRLLFDPNIHLTYQQFNVTSAMAHELSHQWFGNLVSPKWWSYLWLNEGFATLFKYLSIDWVHPELHIIDHFIISELQEAMTLDALPQTHPMTFYVETPEAIENMFDDISYCKAGSVLRMFMHAIGEETFKKGLNYYLTNNSLGVADDDTLFESLESATREDKALPNNLNLKDLFSSWSNQKGFPLLTVTRNYMDGSVTLHQEKYNLNRNEIDSTTWWIPYNFASANSPIFSVTNPSGWLQKGQRDVVIRPNKSSTTWTHKDWLIFNRQQTGFYRVLYDTENYNLISNELKKGDLNKIDPINRAQILDDLHDFVITGRASPEILCKMLTYLSKENAFAPWETAEKAIGEWNRNLQPSETLPIFQSLIARLVEPYYKKWTLEESDGEEASEKLSRSTAVNLACEFGVTQCLEDTYTKFKEMINGSKIPQNIRGLVVANGIRSATDDEIAQLWQICVNSVSSDVRSEIISSIRNIPNDSTLQLYLKKTIEVDARKKVGSSERLLLVTTVIDSGQRGVSLGIKFLSGDLEKVNTTIGSVTTILTSVAGQIITSEIETEFIQLLDLAKKDSLISDEEIGTLKKTATEKLRWQKGHLKSFEASFFIGECGKGGVTSAKAFPVLVFLFFLLTCSNRIYEYM